MDEKTIQKWRDALAALLARADAAAAADLATRRALARDFQTFIMDNPPALDDEPETAVFTEMDDIASRAHDALLLTAIEERVAAIASRSAEFAGLTKKVAAQTAANEKQAKALRLEKATAVVNSVTASVNAIRELKAQLEDQPSSEEDFTALVKQLGKALQTLQDVRAAVESTDS